MSKGSAQHAMGQISDDHLKISLNIENRSGINRAVTNTSKQFPPKII